MSSIPSLDAFIQNGTTVGNGEVLHFCKMDTLNGVTQGSGNPWQPVSLWQADGSYPSNGAAPVLVRIPTRDTVGALRMTNPGAGLQKWLVDANVMVGLPGSSRSGVSTLYDRLVDTSGLSGIVTGAQAIANAAVTRYAGTASAGNQIYAEVYASVGNTQTTITASYTNQDGVAGRTTQGDVFGGNSTAFSNTATTRLTLQSGDTGVRSVESVTLAATTGTAGNFGITIARPLAVMSGVAGILCETSLIDGPVEIMTDACLAFFHRSYQGNLALPEISGSLFFVDA